MAKLQNTVAREPWTSSRFPIFGSAKPQIVRACTERNPTTGCTIPRKCITQETYLESEIGHQPQDCSRQAPKARAFINVDQLKPSSFIT